MSNNSLMQTLLGRSPVTGEPLSRVQSDMDRAFDQFRDWLSLGNPSLMADLRRNRPLMPKADVSETDKTVEVDVDLPGVQLKDVDVSVADKMLMIEGKMSSRDERKEKNYHIVERSQGMFSRQIPLGFDVEPEKVKANFSNGVLHVVIDKPAESTTGKKKIEVKEVA